MNLPNLNKMNGWQRLFFALLVFLYLPITFSLFPSNPWQPLLTTKEVLKIIPTEILLLMRDEKVQLTIGDYLQQPNIANEKIDWDKYIGSEKSNFIKYQIQEDEFIFGKVQVAISKEIKKDKHEKIIDDLYLSLKKDRQKKVLWEQFEYLAMAVAFPALAYLLGLTVGWIYRGFRNHAPPQR